ncbi:gluconokinase [Weissella koreensis]|uniref:gluconokinase n=1 Tax=Weissella koreensis TaxID=165096 RepID=UPI0022BA71DF|nr:gluconokinase [Weissella koreensis]MCZ9311234.1 gluconokinase [Weissella koreensis]
MHTYIGVDIGTTSTKTLLYDDNVNIMASTTDFYPLLNNLPDMAEERPDEIFNAVLSGIKTVLNEGKVDSKGVAAVSFSVQQHSLMAVDGDGNPLTNLLTWADNRSEKIVSNLKRDNPALAKELYTRTGVPTHPMAPIFKLKWLKEASPEIFKAAKYWVGIKEYILFRLFGEWISDYSVSSSTGFLNLKNLDWDPIALNWVGITKEQLPRLTSSTDSITGLKPQFASELGLDSQTPFVLGASDGALSNVGVGAITDDTLAVSIGTSAAIRSIVDHPLIDEKGRVYCYPLIPNKKWIIGGPINNGGVIFRWLRDRIFDDLKEKNLDIDLYDYLTGLADDVPAGANGLIFLPYLEGERAPIWDANARGSFFGLNESHSRKEMTRAVLEGIIYNIYSVMLSMREVTGNIDNIMATGGFARSELWCQMMADIFEANVKVPEAFESGTLAAVILAKISLGEAEDLSEVKKHIGAVKTYAPNPDSFPRYRELMDIFISVTRNLSDDFQSISDYQRKYQNL